MSKIYTQNNSNTKQNQMLNSDINADLHKEFMDSKIVYPTKTVIDFILNYSKSIEVKKAKNIAFVLNQN
ncbi:MAG: hypothetical protein P8I93_09390 [Crocinitomicaceae bacterium]|nr:hypothetical protein [Crocinitomicaceae bacterium]